MNGTIMRDTYSSSRSDRNIQTITVINFIEFLLRLKVTQSGVSQHGLLFSFIKKHHVVKNSKKLFNYMFLKNLQERNTMNQPKLSTWYLFKPEFKTREYHQKFH